MTNDELKEILTMHMEAINFSHKQVIESISITLETFETLLTSFNTRLVALEDKLSTQQEDTE